MPSPVKFHINIFFVLHVVQFTAGFKETSTCRSISMTSLRKSPKWTIDKDFMLSTSCPPQSSTVQWSTNCTVLLTNLLILPPRQTGSRLTLSIEYNHSIWTNNEDGSPRLFPMKAFDCRSFQVCIFHQQNQGKQCRLWGNSSASWPSKVVTRHLVSKPT